MSEHKDDDPFKRLNLASNLSVSEFVMAARENPRDIKLVTPILLRNITPQN
jgi:hypothetical protein